MRAELQRFRGAVPPHGRSHIRVSTDTIRLVLVGTFTITTLYMAYSQPSPTAQKGLLLVSIGMMLTFVRLADQIIRRRSDERQMARISNAFDIMARRLGSRGVLGRDFTPNDYEALLALDEDTPTTRLQGASQAQVNRLPTYKFKAPKKAAGAESDDVSSAGDEHSSCMVCLCDFEDGDTLKIVPCFHKFHQECIDRWLLQKAECPVCKASARGNEPIV